MAVSNVFSTPDGVVGNLNGFFKETYADHMKDLIPDGVKLLNEIKFISKDKQNGNLYHQPIILGMEHGVTFASSDEDAFTLNPAVAGSIKDAQVRGYPLVLRSVLGYSAASRAVNSKAAFEDASKYLVSNMLRSVTKKLEIELYYGQMGYGIVSAATDAPNTITISTAQWAPGIWAGAEGMPIQIYDTTGVTLRLSATITAVDMELRKLTLSAAPVAAGVVATDVVFHQGANGKEFPGIHKILTTTSTLFNISPASYALFKGTEFDAGSGALSLAKLNKAIARGVEKGLDSKVMVMVNPRTWSNLLNDEAALRHYDQSYSPKQLENGAEKLKFHSLNGEMEIVPSIYVKEGFCYILAKDDWMRVGSTEVTFKRPGRGDEFFRDLDNAAGYELRLYTDQAIFCMAPGRSIIIKNIVNS